MRRLLIRPGGIGDCITCLPILEHLRADYTEVWVPGPVVPLISFAHRVCAIASTGLDNVGIGRAVGPSLVQQLRSFDDIWSWYGSNRPEFRREATTYNPHWRFLTALPAPSFDQPATDFFARECNLQEGLVPRLPVGSEPRVTVVIHPFSGGRSKNWPLSAFRQVAASLPLPVEWTAGPEESLPDAHRFNNLLDLARWIRGARLYIGNDSGITHLAAATGITCLGLYRSENLAVWRARGPRVHSIDQTPIEEIPVKDVLQKALRLLATDHRI